MGQRESKRLSEDELNLVTGGLGIGNKKDHRQKCCPVCESSSVESYHVGFGWRQRRIGRCKSCGYEGGWGSFV